MPTGNPCESPHGIVIAGWPVTSKGQVFAIISKARATRSSRGESAGGILVASMVAVLHVLTQQHDQFDRVGEVIGPRDSSTRIGVQERGAVVSLPVRAHAIAAYH